MYYTLNIMKKAIIKFNNGNGAILCPKCRVIIKTFADFTKDEEEFYNQYKWLPVQYCDKCKKY